MTVFGTALRSDVDLDCLRIDLVAVIEVTNQPEHALLWLRAAPLASMPSVQEVLG